MPSLSVLQLPCCPALPTRSISPPTMPPQAPLLPLPSHMRKPGRSRSEPCGGGVGCCHLPGGYAASPSLDPLMVYRLCVPDRLSATQQLPIHPPACPPTHPHRTATPPLTERSTRLGLHALGCPPASPAAQRPGRGSPLARRLATPRRKRRLWRRQRQACLRRQLVGRRQQRGRLDSWRQELEGCSVRRRSKQEQCQESRLDRCQQGRWLPPRWHLSLQQRWQL